MILFVCPRRAVSVGIIWYQKGSSGIMNRNPVKIGFITEFLGEVARPKSAPAAQPRVLDEDWLGPGGWLHRPRRFEFRILSFLVIFCHLLSLLVTRFRRAPRKPPTKPDIGRPGRRRTAGKWYRNGPVFGSLGSRVCVCRPLLMGERLICCHDRVLSASIHPPQ